MDSASFLLSLRRHLAFLLAKAACEVFPDAQVVAAQGTDAIFFVDICFSQTFEDAYLPLIKEKFSRLVRDNPSVSCLETVVASARGLIERAGQELQLAQLPMHSKMLVDIWILDEFALLCPSQDQELQLPERLFYEILQAVESGEVDGQPVTRIMGIACEDFSSLKNCKKMWTRNPYIHPDELVLKAGLIVPCDDSWIWLPRGEWLRQELYRIWQERLLQEGFRMVSTGGNFPFEQGLEEIISHFPSGDDWRLAEAAYAVEESTDFQSEGILTPCKGWTDRFVRICPKGRSREVCISSLQSILQIPRMLSFEAQVVLCSSLSGDTKDLRTALDAAGVGYLCEKSTDKKQSCIEVRIRDRLGRWWVGPSLWVELPKPGLRAVFASCFGKWERLVGLLIEKLGNESEMKLEQFIQKRTGSAL